MTIDFQNETAPDPLESYAQIFLEQLTSCLEECARGRQGLFGSPVGEQESWPEAEQLRQLAMALQPLFAQQERQNVLVEEFLDLCSMHGESHPGEARLARAFRQRIERGEVGKQAEGERRPW